MFFLIGIGLKPKQLTLEAAEAIKQCKSIFLDSYTSEYCEGNIEELEKIAGKKIIRLERKGVEEGFGLLLKQARTEDIALLVFGNALTATTHVQLLLDAKQHGIQFKHIQGISVQNLLTETGLDAYKFGRTVTIVKPRDNYAPESFFEQIEQNQQIGLHTLCLLDIDAGKNYFMTVSEALQILEKIAHKHSSNLLNEAQLVGLYALGAEKQKIKTCTLKELKLSSYAGFPQSLIICGKLNEKEKEALVKLHG